MIGCGSGPGCDGQILIAPDILGLTTEKPKFAKNYCDIQETIIKAFGRYDKDVKGKKYPDAKHSYHIKSGELKKLIKTLADREFFF